MSTPRQRILLFVHYNWRADLSEHVLYTLRNIRPIFDTLVVISNSPLNQHHQAQLTDLTDLLLIRQNEGFDFGAWKAGLEAIGWSSVREAESLTLMNDSCFGPLFELAPLYQRMQKQDVDFWGLTNHRPSWNRIRWKIRRIPYHLQSYFLVFHRTVLSSAVFFDFWQKIETHNEIWDVIVRYEITLTRILRRAGFVCAPVIDTTQEHESNANWSHYHPDRLIMREAPFIKIKGIPQYFPSHVLLDHIRKHSAYPIDLIKEYYQHYCRPDISLRITDAAILSGATETVESSLKAALHIHVRDPAALPLILQNGAAWTKDMDVFVSAPDRIQCRHIEALMKQAAPELMVKKIRSYAEDQHPSVVYAKQFEFYDVVGYVLVENGQAFGTTDQHRVIRRTLLEPSAKWLSLFAQNQNLGLVYADQPAVTLRHPSSPDIASNLTFIKNALRCIRGGRQLQTEDMKSFIAPFNSAFWYRPDALAPVLDWLQAQTTPPIGQRAATALRLLPVYSAWMRGYRFRIILPPDAMPQSTCHQQAIIDQAERLTCQHLPLLLRRHATRFIRAFRR